MNGKLFPFGFLHILNAKKNCKDVIFYLIGVYPNIKTKVLQQLFLMNFIKLLKEKGY